MSENNNLGQWIRRQRKEHHYSQEELAKKLYISRQTLSNWENGKTWPDVENLLALSKLFDVSFETIAAKEQQDMKPKMDQLAQIHLNYQSGIMAFCMLFACLLTAAGIVKKDSFYYVFAGIIYAAGMIMAFKIEKIKKEYDLITYRQIEEFMETGKIPQTKIQKKKGSNLLKALFAAAAAFIVMVLAAALFSLFK